jgi:hypothetical protein
MTAARQIIQSRESSVIEAADQAGHRIMNASARCPGCFNQGHSIGDRQQGYRSLMAAHGFARSAAHSPEFMVFGFSQRAQWLGNRM